jgi:hypothetical protein
MTDFPQFKSIVQRHVDILEETIGGLREAGIGAAAASRWLDHLELVRGALQDSLLRVAVVGAVKSGKSTLINSLLGRDLLKRGAGIITAFITRVRADDSIGGRVELKSWPRVLREINEAVRLLPVFAEGEDDAGLFDIRSEVDRRMLQMVLDRTRTEWQHASGGLDPAFVLLDGYLGGFGGLQDQVGEEPVRLTFDETSIGDHRPYVGRDGQAAYVSDIELHYPVPWLGKEVEIADCQGSDSPNPLHFALLQEYLIKSHFVVFVISGRTGLREADFKLLKFIGTLRLFPRTFFVLNLDFGLHSHRADLEHMVKRVTSELEWVVSSPRLHAFSALYHLMDQTRASLAERDALQLDLWRKDVELLGSTDNAFASFRKAMEESIAGQRSRNLMEGSLTRLAIVAGGIADTVKTQAKLLDRDFEGMAKSSRRLELRKKALENTFSAIENTVAGLKESVKQELDRAVTEYFDLYNGPMVKGTLDLIERYPMESGSGSQSLEPRRIMQHIHGYYLGFRRLLARHLVDTVNLDIIEFAKEKETYLQERLGESYDSFVSLYETAIEGYRREMAGFEVNITPLSFVCGWDSLPNVEIVPPTFSTFVDHEASGRGVLLLKFGLGRFAQFLTSLKSKIGKRRDLLSRFSGNNDSVRDAMELIRSEVKNELIHSFHSYRESFRTDYLHRLLDDGIVRLLEKFKSLNEASQQELADFVKLGELEGEKRRLVLTALEKAEHNSSLTLDELRRLGCEIIPEGDRGTMLLN